MFQILSQFLVSKEKLETESNSLSLQKISEEQRLVRIPIEELRQGKVENL